jgi:hypothetical protein
VLDGDGQRPDALGEVLAGISTLQVTFDFPDAPAAAERARASLERAAAAGKEHALVITPRDGTSDGQILRLVEQTHATVPGTKIVVHPAPGTDRAPLDRRYAMLLEQATAIHRDTELVMRIPGPVGMR